MSGAVSFHAQPGQTGVMTLLTRRRAIATASCDSYSMGIAVAYSGGQIRVKVPRVASLFASLGRVNHDDIRCICSPDGRSAFLTCHTLI